MLSLIEISHYGNTLLSFFFNVETRKIERYKSWDRVEMFLKTNMEDLTMWVTESIDPTKNVLLSVDHSSKCKGSHYAYNVDMILQKNPAFKRTLEQCHNSEDSMDINNLITAYIMQHFTIEIGDVGVARLAYIKMKVIEKFETTGVAEHETVVK